MVEHRLPKPRAASANLVVRSIYCWCGAMVEHVTRNDGVVGSIPTTSSIITENHRTRLHTMVFSFHLPL